MTPWEIVENGGKTASEHLHQRAVFAWANCAAMYGFLAADDPAGYVLESRMKNDLVREPVPQLKHLFAIHNQGHGDMIRGARAKAEGVKAGVPDMMLPVPARLQVAAMNVWYHGLFIELKKPKVGRVDGKQSDWITFLDSQGYTAVTCYGWQDATTAIKMYYTGVNHYV